MGCIVLTDHDRSVLFCTTSERALPHEAFIGIDSAEQADDFLEWLGTDPRSLDSDALAEARHAWQVQSHADNGDGEYIGSPIRRATDRLAHDVGRIYDVLP